MRLAHDDAVVVNVKVTLKSQDAAKVHLSAGRAPVEACTAGLLLENRPDLGGGARCTKHDTTRKNGGLPSIIVRYLCPGGVDEDAGLSSPLATRHLVHCLLVCG